MSFNYIGSKKTLINFIITPIESILQELDKNHEDTVVLDGFAGTGIVGSTLFKQFGVNVFANDLEYYSYIINYSLLCVSYNEKIQDIINILNDDFLKDITLTSSLVTDNYTPKGEDGRMFWTVDNGMRCDYSISRIKKMLEDNEITKNEYIFLLASIMMGMDKVANTTSVYGAYLKKFKTSAIELMKIEPIHTNSFKHNNKVYNLNINSPEILSGTYDIVYLDPPYNERQYSSNYHPLNYIAKYTTDLEIYGKTGLIKDYNKSKYCKKSEALANLEELIDKLNAKYILLSYNNEGIMDFEHIKELLLKYGDLTLYKKLYKKYKSNKKEQDREDGVVYEFLFCLQKNNDNVNAFTEKLVE